jgi:hypothetical protein
LNSDRLVIVRALGHVHIYFLRKNNTIFSILFIFTTYDVPSDTKILFYENKDLSDSLQEAQVNLPKN